MWKEFIRRLNQDVQSKAKPAVYWVIARDTEHAMALAASFRKALSEPKVQCTASLVYVPRKLAVFFLSDLAVGRTPPAPLDGVVLAVPSTAYHKQLLMQCSARQGWIVNLSADVRGESGRGQSQDRIAR